VSVVRVVGFDPAFRRWGFAIAEIDTETLQVEIKDLILMKTENRSGKTVRKSSDELRRAVELRKAMQKYSADAQVVFSEIPGGAQSASAAKQLGIVLGILSALDKPLIQVTPIETKLAAVGSKVASKQEMIDWAVSSYPDAPWLMRKLKGEMVPVNDNEHLADAVAVIHAGVLTDDFSLTTSFL